MAGLANATHHSPVVRVALVDRDCGASIASPATVSGCP